MTITTRNEVPVVFDAAGEQLFGILTQPAGEANGIAVLTLSGGGGLPTFGKNQVGTRLARELAARGFHVLRVDYRGRGESGGERREADLDKLWTDDVLGAVRWLEARDLRRVVIIGVCLGARTGLAAAPEIPGLVGIALIAPPVGQAGHRDAILEQSSWWYLKRAASPRLFRLLMRGEAAKRRRSVLKAKLRRLLWHRGQSQLPRRTDASAQFVEPLRSVVAARIPVLLLYGRTDDFFVDFERALTGVLGRMLERADAVTVRITEQPCGNLASLEAQQILLDTLTEWTDSVANDHQATVEREAESGLRVD